MNESMDRALADWLRDGPDQGPREGLERALAAARQVSQRPAWAIPERWLPMQLTMQRAPTMRPVLLLATVALLIMALLGAAILIGSQRRLPEPFGPARNGAIAFVRDGDLFIADGLAGASRPLVSGAERDVAPAFSQQGDRIAFIRTVDEGIALMTDARSALFEGKEKFFRADIQGARKLFDEGLNKLEYLFNRYPDLLTQDILEDELIEDVLKSQLMWQYALRLNGEAIPEQFPLKNIWDAFPERVAELGFSTTFLREVAMLRRARQSLDGAMPISRIGRRLRALQLHLVEPQEAFGTGSARTPLNTHSAFLQRLRELGRERADAWLATHADEANRRGWFR